jgi:hypothetical protein
MNPYPVVDESLDRLHHAGWSPVEEFWTYAGGRRRYRVVVSKDSGEVSGEGKTVREAWWRTCQGTLGGAGAERP